MVLDNFLDAIAKAKKLICESVAQNLKQVLLSKSVLALPMVFNLLLSSQTTIAKAKKPLSVKLAGIFFQLATKICKLEPRPKVTKLFCQWLGGDRIQISKTGDQPHLQLYFPIVICFITFVNCNTFQCSQNKNIVRCYN